MSQQLSFTLASSHRQWLTLRASTNPISATGGPVPRIGLPLEARLTVGDIQVQILRFVFDLKLGNTIVGQGEMGPITYLSTDERNFVAWATCPREALAYLIDPSPGQGRVTLTLALAGLLRYRHSFQAGDGRAQGLGDADTWHIEAIGENSAQQLELQVARSDWYEQVIAQLGIGSYLITSLMLPGAPSWKATLAHLEQAGRALTEANPPAVFGYCRAALDALPGAKTNMFDAMPEGKKRDAINELTKRLGEYLHSGRHVEPNSGGQMAGEFPVDQRDARFAYNLMKLLMAQIGSLTLTS